MSIDWQPTLRGTLVTLRPLLPDDFAALYAVASDPKICVCARARRSGAFRESAALTSHQPRSAIMRTIINIDVPDLERAIAFYSEALGLKLARRLDGDVAELVGASSTVYLLEKREGSEASKGGRHVRRYDERHWTPLHVDFVVDDVDAAAARASRAGAVQESGRIEWRGSTCITFADPFGHGFCFIEFEAGTYSGD